MGVRVGIVAYFLVVTLIELEFRHGYASWVSSAKNEKEMRSLFFPVLSSTERMCILRKIRNENFAFSRVVFI